MNDLVVTSHDGLELAVRDHGGDGPDVVFLHGVTRTLEDWGPVIRRLPGVRAIALDLRGHGRSGIPAELSWGDFVGDVDAVVNGLGLSDPFVVGHSFGGQLAIGYAADHPDCPGVVDVDGFDFRQRELLDRAEPGAVDAFLEDFRAGVAAVPVGAGDDAWLVAEQESLGRLHEAWQVPDDVAAATLGRVFARTADGWERRPPNPNLLFEVIAGAGEAANPLATLRRTRVPAVVVVCRPPGESGLFAEARAGLERHVAAIGAERPGVRLHTIAATHGVIFEQPDVVARTIGALVGA